MQKKRYWNIHREIPCYGFRAANAIAKKVEENEAAQESHAEWRLRVDDAQDREE